MDRVFQEKIIITAYQLSRFINKAAARLIQCSDVVDPDFSSTATINDPARRDE